MDCLLWDCLVSEQGVRLELPLGKVTTPAHQTPPGTTWPSQRPYTPGLSHGHRGQLQPGHPRTPARTQVVATATKAKSLRPKFNPVKLLLRYPRTWYMLGCNPQGRAPPSPAPKPTGTPRPYTRPRATFLVQRCSLMGHRWPKPATPASPR